MKLDLVLHPRILHNMKNKVLTLCLKGYMDFTITLAITISLLWYDHVIELEADTISNCHKLPTRVTGVSLFATLRKGCE